MGSGVVVIAGIVAVLVVCGALAVVSVKNVPPWARMVVYRFGRTGPDLVFGPGRKFTVPIVDHAEYVDMREQTVKLPRLTVVTSDGAARGVECQVRYQIVDALQSSINVANLRGAIQAMTATQLREIAGRMHSTDMQARRVRIAEEIQVKVAEIVTRWGGRVLRVEIGEIGAPNRTSSGDAVVPR